MSVHIYADFNSRKENGEVWLNTSGSMRDMEQLQDELKPGMSVVLYMPDEDEDVEVDAILKFEQVWSGIPDETSWRYVASAVATKDYVAS